MDFKTSSPAVYNGYLGQLYNELSSETERKKKRNCLEVFFLNCVLKESQGQRKDCLETCEGQDVLQAGRGFEKQRMLLFIYYQVLTTSNSSCREFVLIHFFLPSIYLVQNVLGRSVEFESRSHVTLPISSDWGHLFVSLRCC